MRFSEVFLRLGSALVAWLVIYAYAVWLAAVSKIGCGPDGDEVYRVLIGMAALAVGCAFLLGATRPLKEVHSMLKWGAMPLAVLTPFALISIWQIGQRVMLDGLSICADAAPANWEVSWVPVQIVALAVLAVMLVRMWRNHGDG